MGYVGYYEDIINRANRVKSEIKNIENASYDRKIEHSQRLINDLKKLILELDDYISISKNINLEPAHQKIELVAKEKQLIELKIRIALSTTN